MQLYFVQVAKPNNRTTEQMRRTHFICTLHTQTRGSRVWKMSQRNALAFSTVYERREEKNHHQVIWKRTHKIETLNNLIHNFQFYRTRSKPTHTYIQRIIVVACTDYHSAPFCDFSVLVNGPSALFFVGYPYNLAQASLQYSCAQFFRFCFSIFIFTIFIEFESISFHFFNTM